MSINKDKNCQYCNNNFKEEDNIIECPKCGNLHHEECWKENNGCSTAECNVGHEVINKQAEESNKCSKCGNILNNSQLFCTICGTPRTQKKETLNVCSKCGNEIKEEEVFCSKCGHKAVPQNDLNDIPTTNTSIENLPIKRKS